MLVNEENKLSYINNLMFREEFLAMMNRDFHLNSDKPFDYQVLVNSNEPPIVSTEIKEVYTYYPVDFESFEVEIRNIMIEQPLLNKIKVISNISFPDNFNWPVVEDKELHLVKGMSCFTGRKPSSWNLALIDKNEKYRFSDTYHLAYREDYRGSVYEIIQTSSFDPFRMVEYIIDPKQSFETDLNCCEKAKWEEKLNPVYSIKKEIMESIKFSSVK